MSMGLITANAPGNYEPASHIFPLRVKLATRIAPTT